MPSPGPSPGPPPRPDPAGPTVVRVCGPGHHDRAEQARPVIAALAAAGFTVAVSAGLRPRLADDLRAMIDSGADAVALTAPGLRGVIQADVIRAGVPAGVGAEVIVQLVAGTTATVTVTGEGPRAERVRRVLDDR